MPGTQAPGWARGAPHATASPRLCTLPPVTSLVPLAHRRWAVLKQASNQELYTLARKGHRALGPFVSVLQQVTAFLGMAPRTRREGVAGRTLGCA